MSADGVAFLRADVERFCAELVDLRGWLTAPSATTPTTGADPGLVRRAAVGAAAGRRRRLFRQGTARRQAGTRTGRVAALTVLFQLLELRHRVTCRYPLREGL